jgi:hypothetical protein
MKNRHSFSISTTQIRREEYGESVEEKNTEGREKTRRE